MLPNNSQLHPNTLYNLCLHVSVMDCVTYCKFRKKEFRILPNNVLFDFYFKVSKRRDFSARCFSPAFSNPLLTLRCQLAARRERFRNKRHFFRRITSENRNWNRERETSVLFAFAIYDRVTSVTQEVMSTKDFPRAPTRITDQANQLGQFEAIGSNECQCTRRFTIYNNKLFAMLVIDDNNYLGHDTPNGIHWLRIHSAGFAVTFSCFDKFLIKVD